MELDIKKIVTVFKAFCDENRIRILQFLLSGEKCACKLLEEMNITQPTLSHHMKILCDSGIVVGCKEDKWMHYSIAKVGAETAKMYLDALTTVNAISGIKSCTKIIFDYFCTRLNSRTKY